MLADGRLDVDSDGFSARPEVAAELFGLDPLGLLAAVEPSDMQVPVPPFTLPAPRAVEAAALDAAVRAWCVAGATGQASPLTPPLARALRPVADQLVESLRACGYYGPAIQPAPGVDETVLRLNYLGGRENWTP